MSLSAIPSLPFSSLQEAAPTRRTRVREAASLRDALAFASTLRSTRNDISDL
ncbi:MAG: hypothetical protein PUP90_32225 [Nostoc sp. S4]|nr:hypothetical protein [Nostoc sp. S4]